MYARRAQRYAAPAGGGGFTNVWNAKNIVTINETGPKEWVEDRTFVLSSEVGDGDATYLGAETINLYSGGSLDIPGKVHLPSKFHYHVYEFENAISFTTDASAVSLINSSNEQSITMTPVEGTTVRQLGLNIGDGSWLEYGNTYTTLSAAPAGNGWRWFQFLLPIGDMNQVRVILDDTDLAQSSLGVNPGNWTLKRLFGKPDSSQASPSYAYVLFFDRFIDDAEMLDIRTNPWKPWGGQVPSW